METSMDQQLAERYNPKLGEIVCRERIPLRINDDILKCVVFLGYETTDEAGEVRFEPVGTGFFLHFDGFSHLVTARHVAEPIQSGPFILRAASKSGDVGRSEITRIGWFYHPDKNVDVAAIPAGLKEPADWFKIPDDIVLTEQRLEEYRMGIGDEVQIVGLYRLLHGKERHLPIIHNWHIAMMPGDELIPVRDTVSNKLTYAKGYLVEAQTFEGLSGSPVFARNTWTIRLTDGPGFLIGPIRLLGLWRSAWDAPPDEILATQRPDARKVPVGVGIVEPAARIIETLELQDMQNFRDQHRAEVDEANAASSESAPPTKDEYLQHKEDFNRLLTSVATGKPRDDQT